MNVELEGSQIETVPLLADAVTCQPLLCHSKVIQAQQARRLGNKAKATSAVV